jgi:hypothetical protein
MLLFISFSQAQVEHSPEYVTQTQNIHQTYSFFQLIMHVAVRLVQLTMGGQMKTKGLEDRISLLQVSNDLILRTKWKYVTGDFGDCWQCIE